MARLANRSTLDAALATLAGVQPKQRNKLISSALDFRKREVIQEDVLKAERKRRNRQTKRRIKSTLFNKSGELYHLEQLCRVVAGTLGAPSSWKKYFVADPDFVLASTVKKVQRKAAKQRASKFANIRQKIAKKKYKHFPPPDAIAGAPRSKYEPAIRPNPPVPDAGAAAAAAAGAADPDAVHRKKLKKQRRHWAASYGALGNPDKQDEEWGLAGRNRLGQFLPRDEKWPAWNAPAPEVPTNADYYTLRDDDLYFRQYGAYMSDIMLAAMRETVTEIRVLDTIAGHGKLIPIQRLVCEALVSSMFAKWIASVILKNKYLSGGIWGKDIVITNLGNQLDVCRAFFMEPERFTGSADIYKLVKPDGDVAADHGYVDDDDDDKVQDANDTDDDDDDDDDEEVDEANDDDDDDDDG